MLKPYYHTKHALEVGIDEAGRGCLMGPVCVAAVILNPDCENTPLFPIQDSKKCNEMIRNHLCSYIIDNSIAYSVQFVDERVIDEINILKATTKGMHQCLDQISSQLSFDTILVDGNYFPYYTDTNLDVVNHHCIPGGDNLYQSIAAASILAKTYRDKYIQQLVKKEKKLEKYDISNNKGYGTKTHMQSLKLYGPTIYHRMSFRPCRFPHLI
jgi:ribonuclease HII